MSEIHKLIKNLSIYTLGNSLTNIIAFILIPLYSVYLTPDDYGIISAMGLLANFALIIITLSLDRSIYRCYFDYKSEVDKKIFLGTITISLFVITSSFVILMLLFSKYLNLVFKSISFYPYYLITISTLYISIYHKISTIYYRITEQSKKFVLLSITFFLLQTVFIIYFVVFLKKGAEGKLIASLIVSLIYLPIAMYIITRNAIFKFKFSMFKNALMYSLPVIPSLLSAFALNLSDRVFIEKYYTLSEVGIYSMGYKLAGFITIITAGFYGAYNPMFFRIANFEEKKKSLLHTINNQYIILTFILYFVVFLFAEDIFRIFIDSKYYEAYKIFQLIVIGNVFNTAFSIVNVSFSQDKKMVTIMTIVVGGAILNLGLNFILVPQYGMYGAAYATIISFAALGLVKYSFARNYYFIPWQWRNILSYVSLVVIAVVIIETIKVESILQSFILKVILTIIILVFYVFQNKKLLVKLRLFNRLIK